MPPNPWEHFSAETIAVAAESPIAAVREHWPRLVEQMGHCTINDRPTQVAMIGTVAIETASSFRPVREAYYLGEANGAAEAYRKGLRYYPWYGRGFIQLTLVSNYQTYGQKVDKLWQAGGAVDLITRPDDALDPDISAAVAAVYFRDHGGDNQRRIPKAAAAGDWAEVRRLVQGGSAGLDRLQKITAKLNTAPAPSTVSGDAGYVFPVEGYSGAVPLHWGTFPGASDLFAARGTPVRAIHSGTVVYREEFGALGGNAVQISGDDGLQSYYAHGDRAPQVSVGQRVKAGAYLFGVGDTGNAKAAGPHLHFGMGKEIMLGSGATGGAGSDFDAVGLLRRLLSSGSDQPKPADPVPPALPPESIRELLDRLEAVRASIDDYQGPPADPPSDAKKDTLWAVIRNYQAWRDAVIANRARVYQEIGAIGAELRRYQ